MNQFETIFKKQKDYFNTDATKPYDWRMDQLNRMAAMLNDHRQAFQDAVSEDFKTALEENAFEVIAPLATIEFTKSQLRDWMKPVDAPIPKTLSASGHRGVVMQEPYGVTLIIGPFNGPLTLLLDPAINVISAGNPCILKVSEAITASSSLLMKLIPEYFDPESLTVVSGTREEVTELLKLPFDFIFFTGSVRVGKIIARAAAENLTPVILELGGQNPAFVDRSANLPDAAKKIVWGATAWGGQWCTSPGYAYVDEAIAEEFAAECVKAVQELYGADPKNNKDYSRIINATAVKRLASLIDQSRVIAGGNADPENRYIDPTILYPISWLDPIMEDEIFGPFLPILTYTEIGVAFTEVKKRPKPLAAFLFSRDKKTQDYFLESLSFGGGAINQTNVHLFIETMPFGGVGNSGIGHYYGKAGFDALSHAKSILISPPDVAIDHLFPPYTAEKVEALQQWFQY